MSSKREAFEAWNRGPGAGCRESHEIEAYLHWDDDECDYHFPEAAYDFRVWQAATEAERGRCLALVEAQVRGVRPVVGYSDRIIYDAARNLRISILHESRSEEGGGDEQ